MKHLLLLSFILPVYFLAAQDTIENNDLYSIISNGNAVFKVNNLNVNTENQDFGAVFYRNMVVFTSSRPYKSLIKRVGNMNNLPFLDLYIAEMTNSDLVNVKSLSKNINKKYHEGPASFDATGYYMVFTRNNYGGKSKDNAVKLQLFTSKFQNNEWTAGEPMAFNSNEYSVAHPSLTADGTTMYFVSDMPGGFGGTDIYVTTRNEKGEWSNPINLGSKVNTEGNEMFPFIYKDENLFFASTGHQGLGGLDVFLSQKTGNEFTEPVNVGTPVNSNKDDFAFVLDKDANKGYFSSNREGGKGDDDIYSFLLIKPVRNEITFSGKVIDDQGNNLTETFIVLYDGKGNIMNEFRGDENGEFRIEIQPEVFYKLEVKKDNFISESLDIDTHTSDSIISRKLVMEQILNYTVTFHVTDVLTKAPVEKTKIYFKDKISGAKGEITTDEKGIGVYKLGNYKLNDPFDYTFEFDKDGYVRKSLEYDSLFQNEENFDFAIELKKIEMITDTGNVVINPSVDIVLKGKIVDDRGNILSNTDIVVYTANGNKMNIIKSDEKGEYKLMLLRDTEYRIEGIKEKYTSASDVINTHISENVIVKNLILKSISEFYVICHISDIETKEIISDTKVNFKDKVKGKEGQAYTDNKGKCIIQLEKYALNDRMDYEFTFQKEGYTGKTVEYNTILNKEGNYDLKIELQKIKIVSDTGNVVINPPVNIVLKGKVLDIQGKPIANTDLVLYDAKGIKVNTMKSDVNGEFNLTLLRDEEYKIEGIKEKYKSASGVINTHTTENVIVKNLTLESIPEFYVVCHVSDLETKELISDTKVNFKDKVKGIEGEAYTDNEGKCIIQLEKCTLNDRIDYSFSIQKEGYTEKTVEYNTVLNKEGYYDFAIELQKIKIITDTGRVVVIPPSNITIKGKVVDNQNNKLSNTTVNLYDHTGNLLKTVHTDVTGEYKFTVKPDEIYKLEGLKEKYKPVSVLIEKQNNDTVIIKDLITELIPEPIHNYVFICHVKDKKTGALITNTKVEINDLKNGEKSVLYTDGKGEISIKLTKYKLNDRLDYLLTFDNDAYTKKTVSYDTTLIKDGNYILSVELQKFEIGEDLGDLSEMNPIYFDFDKSIIRPDAAIELDKIVKIMNEYPNLVVELSSYTDCRGTSTYNLYLSNRRAIATANYIKNRITHPERITGKGFGEINLVNDCNCDGNVGKNCTEKDHQENRRTEFKIIKN